VSQIESLSQIEEKLNNLSLTARNNINNANTHEELDQLRVSLLGKKGDLSIILKIMGLLSATDRPVVGQKANLIKINLQGLITERKNQLNSEALDKKIKISKNTYLGDIIISYNYLDKPRSQNLKSFKEKVTKLFIHGFLHLLGFDHKKNKDYSKMLKEENLLFKSVQSKIN